MYQACSQAYRIRKKLITSEISHLYYLAAAHPQFGEAQCGIVGILRANMEGSLTLKEPLVPSNWLFREVPENLVRLVNLWMTSVVVISLLLSCFVSCHVFCLSLCIPSWEGLHAGFIFTLSISCVFPCQSLVDFWARPNSSCQHSHATRLRHCRHPYTHLAGQPMYTLGEPSLPRCQFTDVACHLLAFW